MIKALDVMSDVVSGPLDGDIANLSKLSYMNKAIAWMISSATSIGDKYDPVAKTVGGLRDNLSALVDMINEDAGNFPELFMLDSDLTSYVDIYNDTTSKENISLDEFD